MTFTDLKWKLINDLSNLQSKSVANKIIGLCIVCFIEIAIPCLH